MQKDRPKFKLPTVSAEKIGKLIKNRDIFKATETVKTPSSNYLEAILQRHSIKKVFLKIRKIHRKTHVPESLFQVFSSEFCEFLRTSFFIEHLWRLLLIIALDLSKALNLPIKFVAFPAEYKSFPIGNSLLLINQFAEI